MSRNRSRDPSNDAIRPLRPRSKDNDGMNNSRSREKVNDRSRSFERSFNSGPASGAHSQYLKQVESGVTHNPGDTQHQFRATLSKSDYKDRRAVHYSLPTEQFKRSEYEGGAKEGQRD